MPNTPGEATSRAGRNGCSRASLGPSAGRLTFSTWKHYDKDSPLLPSGLLGPVRVLHVPLR